MFSCTNCGNLSTKWSGRCLCGKWNSFTGVEENTLELPPEDEVSEKLCTNIEEFDRVCSLFTKSIVLIGGEPGIGKSTLMCQVAAAFAEQCLYLAGEESSGSVRERVKRVANNVKISISPFNFMEHLEGLLKKFNPKIVILDSIHTTRFSSQEGQAKDVIFDLLRLCKKWNFCLLLVSHITKEGIIAGPKTLEHMVDVVLYLEGDRYGDLRLLRAIKNRFGNTGETGIFSMKSNGLVQVHNPSALLISSRRQGVPGSVIFSGVHGSRPFLFEIQALVVESKAPQLEAVGLALKRIRMIIAILNKWCDLSINMHDVFINCVGGIKVEDPACDLAIAMAIMSSVKQRTISAEVCFFGELGLTGEVRQVSSTEMRIAEAKRLGFKKIFCCSEDVAVTKITSINQITEKL